MSLVAPLSSFSKSFSNSFSNSVRIVIEYLPAANHQYDFTHFRALQRRPSSPEQSFESSGTEVVGGARKKSLPRPARNGNANGHHHYLSHNKKRRRPENGGGVAGSNGSGGARIENGEFRPFREDVGILDEEDEGGGVASDDFSEDNRTLPFSRSGGSNNSRANRHKLNSRGSVPNERGSGLPLGSNAIPPGQVGGPSKVKDKDELNHIIPESKKFPQVRKSSV